MQNDDAQTIQPEGWQVQIHEEARGLREERRPRASGVRKTTFRERFWSHVEKLATECGCWLWTGAVTHDHYGRVQFQKKARLANRVSWIMRNGPIPEGKCILHRCDTPECVNPNHLFLGTCKDNSQDASKKGRLASGDRCWQKKYPDRVPKGRSIHTAKLNEEQVLRIRGLHQAGYYFKSIARAYKMDPSTISDICYRRIWKHVD